MHIKGYNPVLCPQSTAIAWQTLCNVFYTAEQQCIHESPWGSQIGDAAPHLFSHFCDVFSNPPEWKSCSVTAFVTTVNHLVSLSVVLSLSAWLCPIISVLLVAFRQGERETFGLATQINCATPHNYPDPVGEWLKMHLADICFWDAIQTASSINRENVPCAQIAKVPLIKVAD